MCIRDSARFSRAGNRLGGINFEPRAGERCQCDRPGAQPADQAVDLVRGFGPVDHRHLLIQHMRVAALAVVLRAGRDAVQFGERAHQKFRACQREPVEQLACGLPRADFGLIGQQHVARIQAFGHLHGGHAGLLVARDHRPLDRRRTAPARQQRAVHVDAPARRDVEHRFWQQLAVRHDDDGIRCCLLYTSRCV